jgi:hypothetical protein
MDLLARARALAAIDVLADIPAPALVALAQRVHALEVASGRSSSSRRDGSDYVLAVVSGSIRFGTVAIAAGELVGVETALVGGAPFEFASDGVTLLLIAIDDFLDIVAEHAVASAAVARRLAARVREAQR